MEKEERQTNGRTEWKHKKVAVAGLGNSGYNASLLLSDVGADVRATDSSNTPAVRETAEKLAARGIAVETGAHSELFLEGCELLVTSPGIDDNALPIRWAAGRGIPIIGEMELGSRFCRGNIVAVTGTNGKSTTVTLIDLILKKARIPTLACGNIGNALCGEIKHITKDHWVIMEVSSFQLERIETFKPRIAVILNITENHLDRHPDFPTYFSQKSKIFSKQDTHDTLVLNYDAQNIRFLKDIARSKTLFYSTKERTNGAFMHNKEIYCVTGGTPKGIMRSDAIALKGTHNIENVLASCLVATLIGARPQAIAAAVNTFRGLEHRIQTVDTVGGVEFIDDSKSTTVDATARALEWCTKPVILIAGGKDKHCDFSPIRPIAKKKVKAAILIGESKQRLQSVLGTAVPCSFADSLEHAVTKSYEMAEEGDCVLLSPMCSSFDMFANYGARGDVFQKTVKRLKQ